MAAHRLRNVAFPNQMFTLTGGGMAEGTPVVGLANDPADPNMLWDIQVMNLAENLFSLMNVASGTFAKAMIPEAGEAIVGGVNDAQTVLRIVQGANPGQFAIQTVNGEFACTLNNADNFTPVILEDANAGDARQGWTFVPA